MSKRRNHHLQEQDAQHAAETHPDIKRLRLSSSEPETEEAINNNQEQQCSMMSTEPAPAQDHPLNLQHQQHHSAAAAANYAAMNALLKQLHLERLQRMQQAPDGGYYHRQGHPAGGS